MLKTHPCFWSSTKIEDFQGCFVQLIACIGVERTSVQHGMYSLKAMEKDSTIILEVVACYET
jgi:hypothetical protein